MGDDVKLTDEEMVMLLSDLEPTEIPIGGMYYRDEAAQATIADLQARLARQDESMAQLPKLQAALARIGKERDAAITRAETAERERDAAEAKLEESRLVVDDAASRLRGAGEFLDRVRGERDAVLAKLARVRECLEHPTNNSKRKWNDALAVLDWKAESDV